MCDLDDCDALSQGDMYAPHRPAALLTSPRGKNGHILSLLFQQIIAKVSNAAMRQWMCALMVWEPVPRRLETAGRKSPKPSARDAPTMVPFLADFFLYGWYDLAQLSLSVFVINILGSRLSRVVKRAENTERIMRNFAIKQGFRIQWFQRWWDNYDGIEI